MANEKETPSYLEAEYRQIDKEIDKQLKTTRLIPILKKIFFTSWAVLDIVLILGGFFYLVWYISFGVQNERELILRIHENSNNEASVVREQSADDLIISRTLVLGGTDGRSDFFSIVQNPNNSWVADLTYHFVNGSGESTDVGSARILPESTYYITELSQDLSPSSVAELVVDDITWTRITGREVPGIEDWRPVLSEIFVEDITHGNLVQIGDRTLTQTSFIVRNDSPYAYWNTEAIIRLQIGSRITAVNSISIPALDIGEERMITVNWFDNVSPSATASIDLYIDTSDLESYREINPAVEDIRLEL